MNETIIETGFDQFVKKTIKEINPEMDISPEGVAAIKKAVEDETYEMAKEIIKYRRHKTIMPYDVEFGLGLKRKWGGKTPSLL